MEHLSVHPVVQAATLFAGMLVLIAIGVLAVRRFRDSSDDDQVTSSEALVNFREMHAQGVLSDEEFRTIKTQLASQMQAELSDSSETG